MKKGCLVGGLGLIIAVCTVIVLGSMTGTRTPDRQPIEVSQSAWTMADAGTVLHTITLKNTGKDRRHDVELSITYRAKTGTVLATHSKTVYEFIDPGKTITVKVADYAPPEANTAAVKVERSQQ